MTDLLHTLYNVVFHVDIEVLALPAPTDEANALKNDPMFKPFFKMVGDSYTADSVLH